MNPKFTPSYFLESSYLTSRLAETYFSYKVKVVTKTKCSLWCVECRVTWLTIRVYQDAIDDK